MGKIINNDVLCGKYVNLRQAEEKDAEFTLKLRLDERFSGFFVTKVNNNIDVQKNFINKCLNSEEEYFFIVEDKQGNPLGTTSIYNVSKHEFTSGRWIMLPSASFQQVVEGEFLMKNYAFNILQKDIMHLDVIKENAKVLFFHKQWGAKETHRDDKEVFLTLSKYDFTANINKMKRYFQ